ncbi:membrane lipoprotein lipid attachment site-containing protein [Salmonella enterica]|nr:hypothetical protein [Salmonella enterica]ECX6012035.1 hypothetical protein [Salmonella enterica subsp. enterica serovar Rubislaw]ECZ5471305.1 hypothetical protein [Salmonella enterica subsp. houtenae]ECV4289370.1 hypothetical protein [Salmonella enterica]EEF9470475.1 hypothetical protein [Salmonella enterica]
MKKIILILTAFALLSGCSTTMKGGSGQLFELSERHVIYRDLTAPEGPGNEPQRQNVTTPGIAP